LTAAAPVLASGALTPAAVAANVDIYNFGKVSDTYYRGAAPKGEQFHQLKTLGIKTDIDLAKEGDPSEGPNAEQAGLHFVRIPMTTHAVPSPAVIAQFLSIVNDPANQPVYVHCIEGRHRTGVMTAIYRMTNEGWTSDRAFSEMKQYRFGADFLHQEFKKFVYAYSDTAHAAFEALSHAPVAAAKSPSGL
jgi:protein tyrosine/serine phosphatase